MTKDKALKLALEVNESMKDVLKQVNELIAENKALKEALAQPEQEPVDWEQIYWDMVNAMLRDKLRAQPAQEPVAFAGIEMWVGNARIAKYLTQTELHYARDPWMLMQYSADLCLAKLKENNNG